MPFGLVQGSLVGLGIDHHDGLALPHLLALGKLHRLQLPLTRAFTVTLM